MKGCCNEQLLILVHNDHINIAPVTIGVIQTSNYRFSNTQLYITVLYRKRCVVSLILILSSYFSCMIILLVSERAESHKRRRSSIGDRFICFLLSCARGWMIMVWNLHYAISPPTYHKTLTFVYFMTGTNGILFLTPLHYFPHTTTE